MPLPEVADMPKVLRVLAALLAALVILGFSQNSVPRPVQIDTEIAEPDPPTGG